MKLDRTDGVVWTLGLVGVMAAASMVKRGSRALSKWEREALPQRDFVFPKTRRYPIYDRAHAKKALTMATWSATSRKDLPRVKRAVFARYPGLKTWWNRTPWVSDHPIQAVRRRRVA